MQTRKFVASVLGIALLASPCLAARPAPWTPGWTPGWRGAVPMALGKVTPLRRWVQAIGLHAFRRAHDEHVKWLQASPSREAPDPETHRLSARANEQIFRSKIVRHVLHDGPAAERPVVVLVGGAPGVGKTSVYRDPARMLQFEAMSGGGTLSVIDPDELRRYHPKYRELAAANDRTTGVYTRLDTAEWVRKSVEHMVSNRRSFLLEGPLYSPTDLMVDIDRYHRAGYRVVVAYVAAPRAMSSLGILQRYYRQRDRDGYGRHCPTEVHDLAYDGMSTTASSLDATGAADALYVFDRDGNIHYRSAPANEEPAAGSAHAAIERIRTQTWSPHDRRWFLREVHALALRRDLNPEDAVRLHQILEMAPDRR